MRTAYVVFTEDKQYLLWQTELLLHSIFTRAGISLQDCVVLYTDPEQFDPRRVNDPYQPSPYLSGLLEKTPSTRFHRVENFGRRNWYFKFKGEGAWDNKSYPGLNKWSSLVEAANAGWFEDFD